MAEYNSAYTGAELDTSITKTLAQPIANETFSGGFFDYNDLATATTPIVIPGTSTFTLITNDGLGAFTNKAYKPSGITDIFNTTTNQFDFAGLKLGDMLDIRFDILVTTTSPNQEVDVSLFLGVGASEYSIPFEFSPIKSSGVHEINRFNGIYLGDNNTLNNPAEFRLSSDSAATVVVNGMYIKIIKRG